MRPLRNGFGFQLRARFLGMIWVSFVAAMLEGRAAHDAVPFPPGMTNVLAREIFGDRHFAGVRNVHILAFKSQVDDRPWWVDHALVVVEMSRGRWELWHLARNPRSNGKRSPWTESHVTDSTQRGSRSYDHRPTAADLKEFVSLSYWSFAADPPFRLIRGTVDDALCRAVLGFESGYRFPEPSPPSRPAGP